MSGSRCLGVTFLVAARNLGYRDHDARRVWRRVVSRAMGAEYSEHAAFNEIITYSQLWEVVQGERTQFLNMTEADWQMIIGVAQRLFSELPE